MATRKKQAKEVTGNEKKEKKTKKGSTAMKVAGGVLAGAAAGAIAGILLAPDSGKNTRKKISEKSKKVVANVKKAAKNIRSKKAEPKKK